MSRSGDRRLIEMLRDSLDAFSQEGEGDNAVVMRQVGRPLIDAMLDFAEQRYGVAVLDVYGMTDSWTFASGG